MLAKNKDDMKAKVQEEVTAQFAAFMQNYGKTAIFANAGAVLPNVHPIESAPPTMPFLQVLGFHSGGANLPESEPSPALVPEPSHHSTDHDMRDPSPSPPHSP